MQVINLVILYPILNSKPQSYKQNMSESLSTSKETIRFAMEPFEIFQRKFNQKGKLIFNIKQSYSQLFSIFLMFASQ